MDRFPDFQEGCSHWAVRVQDIHQCGQGQWPAAGQGVVCSLPSFAHAVQHAGRLHAVQHVQKMVESTPHLRAIVLLTKGLLQVDMLTGVRFVSKRPLFRSSVAMYQFTSWLCCLYAEGCKRFWCSQSC